MRQKRYDEAIVLLNHALAGADELYANSMVQDMHRQLYLAHRARGDLTEALAHLTHEGNIAGYGDRMFTSAQYNAALGLTDIEQWEARFSGPAQHD